MVFKEVCRYSPNFDFSIQEEDLITHSLCQGKTPSLKVASQLKQLGYTGKAFQTESHVMVLNSNGEILLEIHDRN